MKKLIRGILDFRKNVLPSRREVFAKLAGGQTPDVLFITCSDSRVAPNWFASTDPGDLFVVRNVGNMVPACDEGSPEEFDHSVAAAIEFAVAQLKVQDIVVCGHSGCGAIQAIAGGLDKLPPNHLRQWLKSAEFALRSPTPVTQDELSKRSVLKQIDNLKTYPSIQERLKKGELKLHAWWFDIAQAGVFAYSEKSKEFILIDENARDELLGD